MTFPRRYPGRRSASTRPEYKMASATMSPLVNPAAPFPLIKDLVDWLDDGCEWLVDGLYAAAFPNSSVEDDPLWVEVHIREDIEPGEITYYPQPA